MTQGGLRELIGRAIVDRPFREQLFTDRAAAIRDYDLSVEDCAVLDKLTRELFEDVSRGVIPIADICGVVCVLDVPPKPPGMPPHPGPDPLPPGPESDD